MRNQIPRLGPGMTPVLVVSHERSGTHFTMNTLAGCFGYLARPWVSVDYNSFNINYFQPRVFGELVQALADARPASTLKSHHEFAFFADFLGGIRGLEVVYVHRHPAAVMASFWRFLHGWEWIEGPRSETLLEFTTTEPMGQLMRYQYRQRRDMLDRWANHAGSWIAASERHGHIHVVRYEDLAGDFAGTVMRLGSRLGLAARSFEPPAANENVVPGPATFIRLERGDREAVTRLALQRYPELMARLGYRDPPRRQNASVAAE